MKVKCILIWNTSDDFKVFALQNCDFLLKLFISWIYTYVPEQ